MCWGSWGGDSGCGYWSPETALPFQGELLGVTLDPRRCLGLCCVAPSGRWTARGTCRVAISGIESWVTERSVPHTKPDTVMQSVTSPFFGPKGQRSKALGNAQGKRGQTHTALKGRRGPSCRLCVLPQAVPPFQG